MTSLLERNYKILVKLTAGIAQVMVKRNHSVLSCHRDHRNLFSAGARVITRLSMAKKSKIQREVIRSFSSVNKEPKELKNIFYNNPYLWFFLSKEQFQEQARRNLLRYRLYIELPEEYSREIIERKLNYDLPNKQDDVNIAKWAKNFLLLFKKLNPEKMKYNIAFNNNIERQRLWTDFFHFVLRLEFTILSHYDFSTNIILDTMSTLFEKSYTEESLDKIIDSIRWGYPKLNEIFDEYFLLSNKLKKTPRSPGLSMEDQESYNQDQDFFIFYRSITNYLFVISIRLSNYKGKPSINYLSVTMLLLCVIIFRLALNLYGSKEEIMQQFKATPSADRSEEKEALVKKHFILFQIGYRNLFKEISPDWINKKKNSFRRI